MFCIEYEITICHCEGAHIVFTYTLLFQQQASTNRYIMKWELSHRRIKIDENDTYYSANSTSDDSEDLDCKQN